MEFILQLHPDASKTILGGSGTKDNVPDLWKPGSGNQAEISRYEYAWVKGYNPTIPTIWTHTTAFV